MRPIARRRARGLFALADAHGCALIGGDTTAGPLNICITVFGEVPVVAGRSQALLRSGARAGDDLYVSGTTGQARLALDTLQGRRKLPAEVLAAVRTRLEQPTPRVALGQALRGVATAAIDLSDGLLGDLGHILQASACGATVLTEDAMHLIATEHQEMGPGDRFCLQLAPAEKLPLVLAGGDDYELLFTAPATAQAAVQAASRASATPVRRIGRIDAETGLRLLDALGRPVSGPFASFDHFA